jgi:hypothetical protein
MPGKTKRPLQGRRQTVYQLEMVARQKYPGEDWAWHRRYAKMISRIIGWEKNYGGYQKAYGLDVVLLFVNEEDIVTRSPAKKQAIEDWRMERGS